MRNGEEKDYPQQDQATIGLVISTTTAGMAGDIKEIQENTEKDSSSTTRFGGQLNEKEKDQEAASTNNKTRGNDKEGKKNDPEKGDELQLRDEQQDTSTNTTVILGRASSSSSAAREEEAGRSNINENKHEDASTQQQEKDDNTQRSDKNEERGPQDGGIRQDNRVVEEMKCEDGESFVKSSLSSNDACDRAGTLLERIVDSDDPQQHNDCNMVRIEERSPRMKGVSYLKYGSVKSADIPLTESDVDHDSGGNHVSVEVSKSTIDGEQVGSSNINHKDGHGTGTTANHTGSSRDTTEISFPCNMPHLQGDKQKSVSEDIPQHVEGGTNISLTEATSNESNNHDKKYNIGGVDKGKPDCNPYLNKTVRVIRGQFEGLTGKIVKIHSRGWWSLDNPKMKSKNIHPRFCELVDKLDQSEVELLYKNRAKGRSLPGIILRQQEKDQGAEISVDINRPNLSKSAHETKNLKRPTRQAVLKSKVLHDRILSNEPKQIERNTIARKKRQKTVEVTISSTLKDDFLHRDFKVARKMTSSKSKHLVPALNMNNIEEVLKKNHFTKSLPPDMKVDVFDRKTGRVLNGDNSIPLKDLALQLRRHVEYEPLLPNVPSKIKSKLPSSISTAGNRPQEARSATNTHLNRNIQPQIRVRASAVEGRRVKIVNGPYRGIVGSIESCIPGNWYIISDLSQKNKFDLDYIVHAKNLKILNESTDNRSKHEGDLKNSSSGLEVNGLTSPIKAKRKYSNAFEDGGKEKSEFRPTRQEEKEKRSESKKLSYCMLHGNEKFRTS